MLLQQKYDIFHHLVAIGRNDGDHVNEHVIAIRCAILGVLSDDVQGRDGFDQHLFALVVPVGCDVRVLKTG